MSSVHVTLLTKMDFMGEVITAELFIEKVNFFRYKHIRHKTLCVLSKINIGKLTCPEYAFFLNPVQVV